MGDRDQDKSTDGIWELLNRLDKQRASGSTPALPASAKTPSVPAPANPSDDPLTAATQADSSAPSEASPPRCSSGGEDWLDDFCRSVPPESLPPTATPEVSDADLDLEGFGDDLPGRDAPRLIRPDERPSPILPADETPTTKRLPADWTWFYQDSHGAPQGPVSWGRLQRLASEEEDEEIIPFTLVRRSDTDEWQRAGSVKGLFLLPKARLAENRRQGFPKYWKDLLKGKLRGHRGMVNAVRFSPHHNVLASGGFDNKIIIWDLHTCSPLNVLRGHEGWINCIAFSPSGDELASASFDGTIRLWDAWTGQSKAVLRGHEGPVFSVTYHSSGGVLASGGEDGTIRQWDVNSGQQIRTFARCGWVEWLAFDEVGGSLLSTCCALRGGLEGRDTETGKGRRLCEAAYCHSGSLDHHSRTVALPCGGFNGAILLHQLDSQADQFWQAHESVVTDVVFSPDGKFLVSGSYDGLVKLWSIAFCRSGPTLILPGHTGQVCSVAFSCDGKTVASAGADSRVLLWDVGPFVDFVGEVVDGYGPARPWVERPIGDGPTPEQQEAIDRGLEPPWIR